MTIYEVTSLWQCVGSILILQLVRVELILTTLCTIEYSSLIIYNIITRAHSPLDFKILSLSSPIVQLKFDFLNKISVNGALLLSSHYSPKQRRQKLLKMYVRAETIYQLIDQTMSQVIENCITFYIFILGFQILLKVFL